jgi:hypothetical protein
VNDCGRAIRVLDGHSFSLKRTDGGIEVEIAGAPQMHDVMQLLDGNGLECEIADIAEEIYQG